MAVSDTGSRTGTNQTSQSLVIALGGNALAFDEALYSPALASAAQALAERSPAGLVLTHGNGPQIGELAMRGSDRNQLDLLGAESEGFIGYLIEQALENAYTTPLNCTTLLTRTEVAADDPAFSRPTKPIGPWLDEREKQALATHDWQFIEDNGCFRRVVPSPFPRRILQTEAIRLLIENGYCVICSGGGGIPVTRRPDGHLQGVDAVIDKDHASALLAITLQADMLVLATDVDGVYEHWGTRAQKRLTRATPAQLEGLDLPEGSMAPKVAAACRFAEATGRTAVIGALEELAGILDGRSGTRIETATSYNGEAHGQ